jgi:hypothetical protein
MRYIPQRFHGLLKLQQRVSASAKFFCIDLFDSNQATSEAISSAGDSSTSVFFYRFNGFPCHFLGLGTWGVKPGHCSRLHRCQCIICPDPVCPILATQVQGKGAVRRFGHNIIDICFDTLYNFRGFQLPSDEESVSLLATQKQLIVEAREYNDLSLRGARKPNALFATDIGSTEPRPVDQRDEAVGWIYFEGAL